MQPSKLTTILPKDVINSLRLPESFCIGTTENNEGCFFDAMAQAINAVSNNKKHSEKSLRMLCYSAYANNLNNIRRFIKIPEISINKYAFIQYTQYELDNYFNGKPAIHGRLEIEGKMLCKLLNLPVIRVIQIIKSSTLKKTQFNHLLITANNIVTLENNIPDYTAGNPILITDTKNKHFSPIVSKESSKLIINNQGNLYYPPADLNGNVISALSQLPCYVICRDTQGNTLWGNQEMAKLAGYKSSKQIETLNDQDAPWAAFSESYVKQDVDAFNEVTYRQLDPFYSADGFQVNLAQKTPLRDSNNNITGVLGYGIKIERQDVISLVDFLNKTSPSEIGKSLIISDEIYLRKRNKFKLTNREMECLFYTIRGKSSKMIASILGISKRTIEKHIENVKVKLNCLNKYELIEKAIHSGLMNLVPENIINNPSVVF